MKYLKIIISFTFLSAISFYTCNYDGITEPEETSPKYGVTGKVLDVNGNPVPNVQIYYLFYYDYLPEENNLSKNFNNIIKVDSFGFNLFQNYPNPLINTLFLRFSIPDKMEIEFILEEKSTNETIYSFSDFYNYGMYQLHLSNFVSNKQLKNGCYTMKLKGLVENHLQLEDRRDMFVISSEAEPNIISNEDGSFYFDYSKSFIGDTLVSFVNEFYPDSIAIPETVNFLFKKEGYVTETIGLTLYPEVLFNQDIILKEVN